MKLLIALADFPDFVAFSPNISPALAAPYLRQAHTFDVQLPAAVRADLETELPVIAPTFKPDACEAADFATEAAKAGWSNTTLARLWYEAIRPLLVLESARRMLLWHGLHITPNGAENLSTTPISSQQRAELRADLQSQAAFYRARYEAGLRSLAPAPATSTCGATSHRRPGRGGLQTAAL